MDYPIPEPGAPLLLVVEQSGRKFGIPVGDGTPAEHTHTTADITDFDERIAEIVTSGEITVIGKSAYESWLELPGNAGKTETEFIASLKGEPGTPGIQGPAGRDGVMPDLSDYATKSYVDGKLDDFEPGTSVPGEVSWEDVTEKPTAFPPSSHAHEEYATISYVNSMLGMEGRSIGKFSAWADVSIPYHVSFNTLRFSAMAARCLLEIKVTVTSRAIEYVDGSTPPPVYNVGDVILDVRLAIPVTDERRITDWDSTDNPETEILIPVEDTQFIPVSCDDSSSGCYKYTADVEIKAFDMDDPSKMIYSNKKPVSFNARAGIRP